MNEAALERVFSEFLPSQFLYRSISIHNRHMKPVVVLTRRCAVLSLFFKLGASSVTRCLAGYNVREMSFTEKHKSRDDDLNSFPAGHFHALVKRQKFSLEYYERLCVGRVAGCSTALSVSQIV
jgi:hypothetical protein